jgi:bifunctional non-homologous end joining protein LigD
MSSSAKALPLPAKKIAHRGIWVEPELLAEIEYRAKSAAGKVRHSFFKGLREDL